MISEYKSITSTQHTKTLFIFSLLWIVLIKIPERYEVDWSIFECDYVRCTSKSSSKLDVPTTQFLLMYQETNVFFMKKYSIKFYFKVCQNSSLDGDFELAGLIRFVYVLFVSFSREYQLFTRVGKHLKRIERNAHIISLMYNLLTLSKDSIDFSLRFDEKNARCKLAMTDDKIAHNSGRFPVKTYPKDVFRFADQRKIGIYGLGQNITINRDLVDKVINYPNGPGLTAGATAAEITAAIETSRRENHGSNMNR